MSARDGTSDENNCGEGKTNNKWMARSKNDKKENEGSEEFYTIFSEIVHFLENKRKKWCRCATWRL